MDCEARRPAGRHHGPLAALACLAVVLAASVAVPAETYRAAAAKRTITPQQPLWAGGYAGRDRPTSDTLQDLYAKVLVLEDGRGARIVFITTDLENMERDFADAVAAELRRRFGLRREQVAVTCSHTHCGPVLAGLEAQITYPMTPEQYAATERYTTQLEAQVIALVAEAISRLAPAELAYGVGRAGFAVNRRNNKEDQVGTDGYRPKGPVDHDVPVLRVVSADGSLMAVLFAYACHPATLDGYHWTGDYAGFAQDNLEAAHPGSTALFVAGCGGDINPLPRRSVELCRRYGRELADAVEQVLTHDMKPITGSLAAAYSEVDLAFETLPTREEWTQQRAEGGRCKRKRAEILLEQMDAGEPLSPTYPYPVQVLQLGDPLTVVVLAGEALVDYSLRLKQELGPARTWVFAYANDLCAYIPPERVLEEGGYEADSSMIYFGRPARWAPGLEDTIFNTVHRLVAQVRPDGI